MTETNERSDRPMVRDAAPPGVGYTLEEDAARTAPLAVVAPAPRRPSPRPRPGPSPDGRGPVTGPLPAVPAGWPLPPPAPALPPPALPLSPPPPALPLSPPASALPLPPPPHALPPPALPPPGPPPPVHARFPHAPPPLPSGPPAVATPLDARSPVRYAGGTPVGGWRGQLHAVSRGRLNPGLSAAQAARQRMIRAIARPLHAPHRIAVMSVKGGVGKTTVAACLGLVLAENRGDRVVALDANPDAGTLADRLTGVTGVTVRDLLRSAADFRSLTDVDRFTSLAGRLQVLASEQDPAAGEAFNRGEYERICAVLARFATIVVTDSGTGLVHSAMEGTLAMADGLVVVGSPTIDGADRAAKTLDWLIAHGHAEQAARALVVLSCDRWSREVDRGAIRAHFAARCRGVVEIPYDPYLAMGGRIVLPALRPATIDAFLLLGALVADGFAGGPAGDQAR